MRIRYSATAGSFCSRTARTSSRRATRPGIDNPGGNLSPRSARAVPERCALDAVRLGHDQGEIRGDRLAQRLVLLGVRVARRGPAVGRVVPDWADEQFLRLPAVAGEQVRVQVEGVGVAEDLVVQPPKRRVEAVAAGGDRLAEQ